MYIINEQTLGIASKNKKTIIYEIKGKETINNSITEIINKNCILNGSTLEGRQKSSIYLTGSKYKPPFVLNENIILIPTHSLRNKNCIFLVLSNIMHYYPNSYNKAVVEFINKEKIELSISYKIFDHQILLATRLESAIRGQKHKNFL